MGFEKKIHIFLKRTRFNFSSGFIPFRASMCGAFAYSTEILTSFSCCSALFWCHNEVSHDIFFLSGKSQYSCADTHSRAVVPVESFAVLWTEVSLYKVVQIWPELICVNKSQFVPVIFEPPCINANVTTPAVSSSPWIIFCELFDVMYKVNSK